MNIALDAMGGDYAPGEIVAGAVSAAKAFGITVSLVGKPEAIQAELAKHDTKGLDLPIVPASQVIEMDDKPANAVRGKKDNSMSVACRLVKSGEAQAFVTAGNTGGALAAGILHLGRIKGIHRPALITPMPTLVGFCAALDIGANADVRPEYLQQFAIMGHIYARLIMGVADPSVSLLSNGEEAGKGNQMVQEAFALLQATPGIRFRGNAEPKEVLAGVTDVVVTDGFTGNIFIKTAEAIAGLVKQVMREEMKADPLSALGGLLAKPALGRISKRLDDSEYGGAVLLGLSNIVVVGHGKTKANGVHHAIRVAKQAIEQDMVGMIRDGIRFEEQA